MQQINYTTNYTSAKYSVGARYPTQTGELVILGKVGEQYAVLFPSTGYICIACSGNISKGTVKNKLLPIVEGVGYMGEDNLPNSPLKRRLYTLWSNMLRRCYGTTYDRYGNTRRTYQDVSVHKDWHSFSTFCKDFKELDGYAEWLNGDYHLDKDRSGSKIYSKWTCSLITKEENEHLGRLNQKESFPPITLIHKDGRQVLVKDYWEFAKSVGIEDKSYLVKVLRQDPTCLSCEGWRVANGQTMYVFEKLGKEFITHDLTTLVEEGCMTSPFWKLIRGERNSHKGFVFKRKYTLIAD